MVKDGYNVCFSNKLCSITFPKGGKMQIWKHHNSLFYLRALPCLAHHVGTTSNEKECEKINNTSATSKSTKQKSYNINNLHNSMGHIGEATIRKTMNYLGFKVRGELAICNSCQMAKAKRKQIRKFMTTRSTVPKERVVVDLTRPFTPTIGGSKYLMEVVDNTTRMRFCYFLKQKYKIGQRMSQFINQASILNHSFKII